MKGNANLQPGEKSRPVCRTCEGKKVINVQAHKGGKPDGDAKPVACPACRGTGAAGYLTK